MEELSNPELEMLRLNKESGFNYQERRHDDWTENYTLYRDKVIINRLIQRQSVNIPLMKQSIRTLLKDVDDMPVLYFENLDNDKQAELFKNEYWNIVVEKNNLEVQDIVDKKQVFMFGRSFKQLQIVDGMIKITVEDPMDILVDRYVDPTNIHSARSLIHTHIFTPIGALRKNPDYNQEAVSNLITWYQTTPGLIKQADNQNSLQKKNEKLRDMGLSDVEDPVLGEAIVELSMHFVYRSEGDEEEQIYLFVEAEDREILMKKRLEEVIDPSGRCKDHYWRNHFPYVTWADDIERQDFWSDGVADIIRQPNKVLNAWFSQLVENRTLRNFGMHYYDSSLEGFTPGSFEPVPWGWYGVPGKPGDVLQKVDIPELSESLDEMQFVIQMMEKATGATATQQGVQTDRQITLGEVQLALGEAKERIKGMSKFYTPAWKQTGELFLKLIEAGYDKLDAVKIFKKGRNSNDIYTREISPTDWMTESGYNCKVWSQEEKNTQDTNKIQKMNLAINAMPANKKLREAYQMTLLEFSDLTPQQINDIMEEERARNEAMMASGGVFGQETSPLAPQPEPNQQMPVQTQ